MDESNPHCAILCTEDLVKAYNRGSHNLVIEDFQAMHVPNWELSLIFSFLNERSLTLNYMNERSKRKKLPGGFGAGTWLGGLVLL
jgi:hypothetical protein